MSPPIPPNEILYAHVVSILTCNWRQISSHRRIRLVFLVQFGHHFNVSGVMEEYPCILILDAEVRQVEALKFLQQLKRPLGAGDALESLFHECTDRALNTSRIKNVCRCLTSNKLHRIT